MEVGGGEPPAPVGAQGPSRKLPIPKPDQPAYGSGATFARAASDL